MMTPPRELLEFLRRYDPATQALALGLRTIVLDELAPCHEFAFQMTNKTMLIYGPTEGHVIEDSVCMIGVFAHHANLQFTRGSELNDTQSMLKGSGRWMRHLQVKRLGDLDQPGIREFLRRVRAEAGMAPPPRGRREVVTRIKKARGPSATSRPRRTAER